MVTFWWWLFTNAGKLSLQSLSDKNYLTCLVNNGWKWIDVIHHQPNFSGSKLFSNSDRSISSVSISVIEVHVSISVIEVHVSISVIEVHVLVHVSISIIEVHVSISVIEVHVSISVIEVHVSISWQRKESELNRVIHVCLCNSVYSDPHFNALQFMTHAHLRGTGQNILSGLPYSFHLYIFYNWLVSDSWLI